MTKKRKKSIRKLRAANWVAKPKFIDDEKPTGIKATGLVYERSVLKWITDLYEGEATVMLNPWIKYTDANGMGWCSPDAVVIPNDNSPPVIFEVKLTVTDDAIKELDNLYAPLLRKLLGVRKIKRVQVAHNLRTGWKHELVDWDEIDDKKFLKGTIIWRKK